MDKGIWPELYQIQGDSFNITTVNEWVNKVILKAVIDAFNICATIPELQSVQQAVLPKIDNAAGSPTVTGNARKFATTYSCVFLC